MYVCKVTNVYSCASEIKISELVMKFESTVTGSYSDIDQISSWSQLQKPQMSVLRVHYISLNFSWLFFMLLCY
jgi:hypothetical protein